MAYKLYNSLSLTLIIYRTFLRQFDVYIYSHSYDVYAEVEW